MKPRIILAYILAPFVAIAIILIGLAEIISNNFKKLFNFLAGECPYCGNFEREEYGYYGYTRCKNCKK